MSKKELTEAEENQLYEELGELDGVVLNASKALAYVYKRRQQIYRIFGW